MTPVDSAPETVIEPHLPIIDPHHHLWDRRDAYANLPADAHPFAITMQRASRYMLDDFLADMACGHDVRSSVFIECRAFWREAGPEAFMPVGETEFVAGVAAMGESGVYGPARPCAAIVGHVDLTLGDDVSAVLDAHVAAGGGRFRGVRHSGSWDADPTVLGPLARTPQGLYADSRFREGFARLAERGLSFDAWLLEPQIPELTALARAFPRQPIVLDHLGTPLGTASYTGRLPERFGVWRDSLLELATCPNVAIKLGGLAMCFFGDVAGDPETPRSAELAKAWTPYIETAIDAFGVDGCMFESNFPVDRYTCDYRTLWNALKRTVAGASAEEKAALFFDTARSVYRL